jgi:hypothetical protein
MYNIFDAAVVSTNQHEYQCQVFPEIDPTVRQPVLGNWHPEDLVPYCGGEFAKLAYQSNH